MGDLTSIVLSRVGRNLLVAQRATHAHFGTTTGPDASQIRKHQPPRRARRTHLFRDRALNPMTIVQGLLDGMVRHVALQDMSVFSRTSIGRGASRVQPWWRLSASLMARRRCSPEVGLLPMDSCQWRLLLCSWARR